MFPLFLTLHLLGCTLGQLYVPVWEGGSVNPDGADGTDGTDGADGTDGTDGTDGADGDDWDGTTQVFNIYDSTEVPCRSGVEGDYTGFIVENLTDQQVAVEWLQDSCTRYNVAYIDSGTELSCGGQYGGTYIIRKVAEDLDYLYLILGRNNPRVVVE